MCRFTLLLGLIEIAEHRVAGRAKLLPLLLIGAPLADAGGLPALLQFAYFARRICCVRIRAQARRFGDQCGLVLLDRELVRIGDCGESRDRILEALGKLRALARVDRIELAAQCQHGIAAYRGNQFPVVVFRRDGIGACEQRFDFLLMRFAHFLAFVEI